jgi:flagellar biosynthesis/type III secretory pathway protein FliH
LWEDVKKVEESEQMRYVSSFERILIDRGFKKGLEQGIERGIEKGIEKGIEEGMQRGVMQGEVRLIERLLKKRFGDLPAWVDRRLQMATESELATWTDAVLTADSVESVLGPSPH